MRDLNTDFIQRRDALMAAMVIVEEAYTQVYSNDASWGAQELVSTLAKLDNVYDYLYSELSILLSMNC